MIRRGRDPRRSGNLREDCQLARPPSIEDWPSVLDVDVCVIHHGRERLVLDEGEVIDSSTR
jgi:hypothetical protein